VAADRIAAVGIDFTDKTHSFDNGIEQVSTIEDVTVTRFTLQPGGNGPHQSINQANGKNKELRIEAHGLHNLWRNEGQNG